MKQLLAHFGASNAIVHKPYLPERWGVHHSKVEACIHLKMRKTACTLLPAAYAVAFRSA